jgi:FOG: WD40 repeat
LKLWEAESGKLIRTFQDIMALSAHLVFSPDGHKLVSGYQGNTVKIWDIESGKSITIAMYSDNEWLSYNFDSLY